MQEGQKEHSGEHEAMDQNKPLSTKLDSDWKMLSSLDDLIHQKLTDRKPKNEDDVPSNQIISII